MVTSIKGLLMFSGGVDSTLLTLKLLEQGVDLHLHHIHLKTREKRDECESKSVNVLIKQFKKIYKFVYSESFIDYSMMPIFKDSNTYVNLAGSFCQVMSFDHVYCGFIGNETSLPFHYDFIDRFECVKDNAKTTIKFPLSGMSKKMVVDELKEFSLSHDFDYLKETFWCRNPKKCIPCGQCRTCKQIQRGV